MCAGVMVNKRDEAAPVENAPPTTPAPFVPANELLLPPGLDLSAYNTELAGSPHVFEDYKVGEKIDHVDGMTVEEAEHQLATRLYQNTARVHFNALAQQSSRFGKRLIYGGVAISLARAIAFNASATPLTCWRSTAAATSIRCLPAIRFMRGAKCSARKISVAPARCVLRLVATKNKPCAGISRQDAAGEYDPAVVLDFDYWAAIPKRI